LGKSSCRLIADCEGYYLYYERLGRRSGSDTWRLLIYSDERLRCVAWIRRPSMSNHTTKALKKGNARGKHSGSHSGGLHTRLAR